MIAMVTGIAGTAITAAGVAGILFSSDEESSTSDGAETSVSVRLLPFGIQGALRW
jgi:hypothetical protein